MNKTPISESSDRSGINAVYNPNYFLTEGVQHQQSEDVSRLYFDCGGNSVA